MSLPLNFSSSDITHLSHTVQRTTRHLREAGGPYREIAHLAWSFTSVLSTIPASVSEPTSPSEVQRHVSEGKTQLAETIRGCKDVVDEAFVLLETYGTPEGRVDDNRFRRVWERARYNAAQVDQKLDAIGRRLTAGITTILLQLDAFSITETATLWSLFDFVRRRQENQGQRDGSWHEVKNELRRHGFRKKDIVRSKRILTAYLHERALITPPHQVTSMIIRQRSPSPGSARSRGRRRVQSRAVGPLAGGATVPIPQSPPPQYEYPDSQRPRNSSTVSDHPPPYSSRPASHWNRSSSTISIPRSRSPPGGRYTAYAQHETSDGQRRRGMSTGQMIFLGVAIASVSYVAFSHYSKKKKKANSRHR